MSSSSPSASAPSPPCKMSCSTSEDATAGRTDFVALGTFDSAASASASPVFPFACVPLSAVNGSALGTPRKGKGALRPKSFSGILCSWESTSATVRCSACFAEPPSSWASARAAVGFGVSTAASLGGASDSAALPVSALSFSSAAFSRLMRSALRPFASRPRLLSSCDGHPIMAYHETSRESVMHLLEVFDLHLSEIVHRGQSGSRVLTSTICRPPEKACAH